MGSCLTARPRALVPLHLTSAHTDVFSGSLGALRYLRHKHWCGYSILHFIFWTSLNIYIYILVRAGERLALAPTLPPSWWGGLAAGAVGSTKICLLVASPFKIRLNVGYRGGVFNTGVKWKFAQVQTCGHDMKIITSPWDVGLNLPTPAVVVYLLFWCSTRTTARVHSTQ